MKPVLILSINRATWGEAYFARALARDARRPAVVLAHEGSAGLFDGLSCRTYGDAGGPRIPELVAELRPAAVVLADLLATTGTLSAFGQDPAELLRLDVPLVAVDTWDLAQSGFRMDVFDGGRYDLPRCCGRLKHRLRPAPFLRPGGPGSCRWLKPSRPVRLLREGRRTVLWCTSRWQQQAPDSAAGAAMIEAVPALLLEAVRRAGPEIDLLHVGPAPFPKAGARYTWRRPTPPAEFRRILAGADLLLTANLASTVVGEAVAAGLPVLAVSCGGRRRPPFYPWTVWPLGLSKFTAPLWKDNPLMAGLRRVDLLDERMLVDQMRSLLYDPLERRRIRDRQKEYGRLLRRLPTPGAALERWIR